MPFSYDKGLVLLSVGVIMFGAFTALVMTADMHRGRAPAYNLRIFVAALSLGLSAWAMQYIGLLAIKLPVRFGYDAVFAAVSGVLAIATIEVAFFLCAARASNGLRLPIGVAVMGAGLAGMHYLAMKSISGGVMPQYSILGVGLSVAIAMQAALLTLWLAFRKRGVFMTFVGAAAIGVSIAAVHYAAMETTVFAVRGSLAGFAVPEFSELSLAWTAAVMIYLFCSVCLAVYALFQFLGDQK